ncbi:VanZ family protein [Prolixibacteraceae bacterium Z1-6]|uniref:VanZ family protein n=1 Tax=Draconibacterium aestuarii TaxID=2998507 RepID=A0A9X3J8J6_9BACT|nr:VanZ family protein [Prolixibacteraceae bacterium Z1-6]
MFRIIKIKKLAGANLVLYAILVVLTPFIMLQNYLQGFVRYLSGVQVTVIGISIPVVLLVFMVLLLFLLIIFKKYVTLFNLAGLAVLLFFLFAGQKISDFYIDFNYYDLQNNWHYFSYLFFSFISWSYFKEKQVPLHRIHLYTWLFALGISLFDELFQNQMSQRVFDLSDVAKDLWGTTTGMVLITFWFEKNKDSSFKIRQESVKAYFQNKYAILVVLLITTFVFFNVSSLLTSKVYGFYVILITCFLTVIIFSLVHLFKGFGKKIITLFFIVLIVGQAFLWFTNRNNNFIFHNNFLTVYRGWFMPFFDVMVFPDKTFRFVDKKVEFNNTDKKVIMKSDPDVILIGAGLYGEGGNGFPLKNETHFILNPTTKKAVQVLIFDSKSACLKYNELSDMGIKTVMVLHKSI